jgi:hypothetical protein
MGSSRRSSAGDSTLFVAWATEFASSVARIRRILASGF